MHGGELKRKKGCKNRIEKGFQSGVRGNDKEERWKESLEMTDEEGRWARLLSSN